MKSLDNLDELFGETLGNPKKPKGNTPSDKMGAMMAELDEYQEPQGTMEDEESYDGENLDLEAPDSLEQLFAQLSPTPVPGTAFKNYTPRGRTPEAQAQEDIFDLEAPAINERALQDLSDIGPTGEMTRDISHRSTPAPKAKGIEIEKTKVKAVPAKPISKKIK